MFTIVIYDRNRQEISTLDVPEKEAIGYICELWREGLFPVATRYQKVA